MSTRQIKIAPSILTADWGHLAEQIQAAEFGGADYIHLDIMDGRFVPNISFGPLVVDAINKMTNLPLDVHLMIVEPEKYIGAFAAAGADIISIHQEATVHLNRALQQIVDHDCRAGVVLNPSTPVASIREVIHMLDMVLIMSVNPGFGGQSFINSSLDKLRRMRNLLDEFNPKCELEVDGGINVKTFPLVVEAGANVIVSGSAIFNDSSPVNHNLASLRDAI